MRNIWAHGREWSNPSSNFCFLQHSTYGYTIHMLSTLHTKHNKFQQNPHFLHSKISPTPKDKRILALPIHGLSSSICLSFFFFFGLILSLGCYECWKDGLLILANIPCSLKWVFLIFCVLSLVKGFRFFGYCFDWIQGNCWLFPVNLWTQKLFGSWFCEFLWVDLYLGVYVRI